VLAGAGWRRRQKVLSYQSPKRHRLSERSGAMKVRDDDLRIRPGRIGNRPHWPKSFVGEVMQAARKAGHAGEGLGKRDPAGSSRFGRGRAAALTLSSHEPGRRVVVMNRIVRHQSRGWRVRSGPLSRHIAYLKREGVTRDGSDAHMFDARSDEADHKAFAAQCEADRHHFRFTVSPENAAEMADLRSFTRELMSDAERDLGTRLDWIAVDHWNTDHAHVHVLVRGRADDGKDLIISRDYISRGLRARAAERVTLELGPRSQSEIRSALEREVDAERWTGLDRTLLAISDEGAGLADLRPGGERGEAELRRLLRGRTAKLQRLGLAEQIAPGQWTLKPALEQTLRALAVRGDIIKTMHRAMTSTGREVDISGFALHGDDLADPVIGRLVERGLHDELSGSAYAIVEGIDGRTHHLRFSELELTSDARIGAIVEAYGEGNAKKGKKLSLAVRSDLTLREQVTALGATWLDRQLLTAEPLASASGFGAEVRDAMHRRTDFLVSEGLARREGQRVVFARGLLDTLRRRDLHGAAATISAETGLAHYPLVEGEPVAGQYRKRIMLSSGRFAMIDDGVGFQLVPWQPSLDQHLGKEISGVVTSCGVDLRCGRKRGLGL
jgi:type IV secretory pathway VirD2 relaxase